MNINLHKGESAHISPVDDKNITVAVDVSGTHVTVRVWDTRDPNPTEVYTQKLGKTPRPRE